MKYGGGVSELDGPRGWLRRGISVFLEEERVKSVYVRGMRDRERERKRERRERAWLSDSRE